MLLKKLDRGYTKDEYKGFAILFIFSLRGEVKENYDESANVANSWLHLHNTHQASLSLRLPVSSRPTPTRCTLHSSRCH